MSFFFGQLRYGNQKLYEKKMADFLHLGPTSKAVDIGCGRGSGDGSGEKGAERERGNQENMGESI